MTISRGGTRMTLVKSTSHHAPTITIGHLDDAGRDILDEKLRGSSTVEEIVEFFKNYVPQSNLNLDIGRCRSRQSSEEPKSEEQKEIKKGTSKPKNQTGELSANSMNTKNLAPPGHQTGTSVDLDEAKNNNTGKNNNNPRKSVDMDKSNNDIAGNIDKKNNDENDKDDNDKESNENKNVPSIQIEETPCITSQNNSNEKDGDTESNNKKERNVFDILDADYLKRMIPYMHPSSKKHTFRFFIDRVHQVCDGKGLIENDILDVMQFRMGGSYLAEMKDLRNQKMDLVFIEEFYLLKDIEFEKEILQKEKKEGRKVRIIPFVSDAHGA